MHASDYAAPRISPKIGATSKQWSRVATRYEKLAAKYAAVIPIAASMHFVNLLL